MKKFTKFLSVFMTAIMTLGMLIPNMAFAADTEVETPKTEAPTKTNTVLLHKLLMSEDELAKWNSDKVEIGKNGNGYDGTQDLDGLNAILTEMGQKTVNEIAGVYFAVKEVDKVDEDGNVTEKGQFLSTTGKKLGTTIEEATSPKAKGKILGGLTTDKGLKLITKNLPQEPTTYEIVEILELSTYVNEDGSTLTDSLAVPVLITLPLVNEDGVQDYVHVYPKNTENKPEIDKNFANGTETDANDDVNTEDIASPGAQYPNYDKDKNTITRQIGDLVQYDVLTKIPADAHYKTLRWEDTMSKGLTFNQQPKSLTVTAIPGNVKFVEGEDYEVKRNQSGFVLTMTKDGLTKVESAAEGKAFEIRIDYSATVNTDAVTDKVDENEIIFNYSNNPKEFNEPRENEVKPKDEKINVEKSWGKEGNGTAPKGIKVTYYLYEKGDAEDGSDDKVVDMIVLDSATGFNYEFTGLDAEKTYYVKETVSVGFGFDPAYTVTDPATGLVSIKNIKDETNPTPLIPTHPKVVTRGKKFVKTNNEAVDSEKLERLAGAEFVVTNEAGDKYLTVLNAEQKNVLTANLATAKKALKDVVDTYNALTAEEQAGQKGTDAKTAINEAQAAYNEAFLAARTKYTWTTNKADAYVLVSDADGRFEITGLDDGKYNLLETKAPEGYALNNNLIPFQVGPRSFATDNIDYNNDDDMTNIAQQVINKNMTIPQTGGIGTAIFIIAGIALMGGAFVAMKRQEA